MSIAYAQRFWRDGVIYESAELAPVQLIASTGFGLADGVFETLAFRQNQLEHAPAHLERLHLASTYFGLQHVPDQATLLAAMHDLLAGEPVGKTSRVRITVARLGPRSTTEIAYAPYQAPHGMPPLRLCSVLRPAGNPSMRFKTLGYTDMLAGQREVGPEHTALFLNQWGRVACATYGNVYVLIDECWLTPSVAEGAFPGIIRAELLRNGHPDGKAVVGGQVPLHMIQSAPLAYSNSLVGLMDLPVLRTAFG